MIQAQVQLECKTGNFSYPRQAITISEEQTNPGGGNPGLVEVGSGTAIDFGDLVDPGLVLLHNIDSDDYVDITITGAIRLKAGDAQLIRLAPGSTLECDSVGTDPVRIYVAGFDS